jgi:uncharacterized membrane protein YbhN (UPF0104 family)
VTKLNDNIKVYLRKAIDEGTKIRQYFLRGHNTWFALFFSMLNFTLIFYNLLFINLFFVPEELKSFSIFFSLFILLYFPTAAIIGWLDFRKGTYRAEQQLAKDISPIWRDLFAKLDSLEKQNIDLLKKLDVNKEG